MQSSCQLVFDKRMLGINTLSFLSRSPSTSTRVTPLSAVITPKNLSPFHTAALLRLLENLFSHRFRSNSTLQRPTSFFLQRAMSHGGVDSSQFFSNRLNYKKKF